MDPLKKWDESVKLAKESKKVGKFQILRGPLLKDAQKFYCASTNFFSQ